MQFRRTLAAPGQGYRSVRRLMLDILLNPNGTVVPTTIYSAPSSFGMSSAFFHFWLAERSACLLRDPAQYSHPAAAAAGPWSNRPAPLPMGSIRPAAHQHDQSLHGFVAERRVPCCELIHADGPGHEQRQRAVRQSGKPDQRDQIQPGVSVPGDRAGIERWRAVR